jgi:steroid delta-isomerase
MNRYCQAQSTGDKAGWLDLFSPDATHEDPVGNPVNAGPEQIGKFWDGFWNPTMRTTVVGTPIVLGNEAIVNIQAWQGSGADRFTVEPIVDLVMFTDEGKIASVRAFYDMSTALRSDPA